MVDTVLKKWMQRRDIFLWHSFISQIVLLQCTFFYLLLKKFFLEMVLQIHLICIW